MNPSPIDYKPSAFYFRRALRDTDDPAAIGAITAALRAELEQLRDFARGHGALDRGDDDGALFEVPVDADEAREAGLRLVCDLENTKSAIRACGLVPPKRHIMRSEAREKGWREMG